MAIHKRLVQFFFGNLDEDTSKKGVRQGDLVQAKNCQMLHTGEHIKRGGFAQAENTYQSKASIVPDLFTSPDGTVKVAADSSDDIVYAQSAAGGEWKSRGGQQRLTVRSRLRFPSTASDEQNAPMIKQAGNWFVWLEDESHFRYAQQDADGTRLVRLSDSIAVNGPAAGEAGSTHVKSFALVYNATFDANNLWVYWVDWTWGGGYGAENQQNRDGVWAMKIPLDWSSPTQMVVNTGTANNRYILTSISATVLSGVCYLAQCGIYTGTGTEVEFRSASATQMDGWSQHFTVSSSGVGGTVYSYLRSSSARSWAASGVCWLSSSSYRYVNNHAYYAFWTQHPTDRTLCDLVLVDVNTSSGATSAHTIDSVNLDTEAAPAILTTNHNYIGQVTGREYNGGVYIVGSVRVSAANDGTFAWTDINTTVKADRVFTKGYTFIGGFAGTIWTARGAWLSHGLFNRPDGGEFLITGFHDGDEIQLAYHLRRLSDGAIVCQFLAGEAAFAGGCGASYGQLTLHVSDIQQPYLTSQPFSSSYPSVVLPTTSANVTGSCDMSALTVSRPTYQQPASARGLAFVPGGVLTVSGGWQNVQESAPMSFPSGLKSYWGEGSS